jgi:hypothetical protein
MSFTILNKIISKARKLTGTGNSFQETDNDWQDRINSFYLYDLPAKFRSLKLKDKYTFNTIQGQDTYPFDSEHYTTVEMPCYCAKREIKLFQDPWSFYGVNFNWQNSESDTQGNGTNGSTPITFTTQAVPLIPSINNNPGPQGSPISTYPMSRVQNILITANTTTGSGFVPGSPGSVNVTDDGQGNLIEILQNPTPAGEDQFNQTFYSNIVGTLNYQTGIANITGPLSQAIPLGNPVTIQYNPATLSIPLSIMFFQNQFTLRPVPDQGYTVELIAYRQPTQVLNQPLPQSGINQGELNEWWELLSCGGALKFFEDQGDEGGMARMEKMLMNRYDIVESRTYAQIGSQSSNTLFRDQLQYNYGGGSFTFGGGGST